MLFEALENRRAEVERHRENSARPAEAFARFRSSGQGSMEFEKRVDFGLTFLEKPMMHYGAEIDLDDLDERLDNDYNKNKCPPLPVSMGYVTDWDTDRRGFYVGAWVGVRVYYPDEDLIPANFPVEVVHHFHFSAVGMKDVPMDLTD